MMQTQVNPALQALLQTAQMVTPDGNGTVAAQQAQAALQKMQPQAAPPGIEALLPGAEVQAAQSAQAAQPATQGDLNRLRQMMAQSAPSQMGSGVGGLGDVRMAEGGIVGYAGPDGSYVDPQFPRVYENYVEPFTGKPRNDREEEELFGPMKTARQRAIEAAAEELLGPASKARLAAAEPSRVKKVPTPADRKKRAPAPTPTPAPSAPIETMMDTRNIPMPSEARDLYEATQRRIEELGGRLSKSTPETPEQQAYRKAQEDQYNRGIAAIDQQRQRFEAAARAGAEARKDQPMENLISRLARAGGAGSLFQGLSRAQLGMEPIIAAQRAAEQAANDKKIQYFDLLDQRKETVEGLKLAALKGDADRVAAETARLRAVDAEIAKLQIGLGEKQAGQRLTGEQAMARTQADIDARAREGEANRKNALQVEGIRSAARTAGAEGRGALTPRDIARLRAQAEKDVDAQLGKDPRYVSMKVRDPVGAATYRTTTIDERLKRVLAEEGYGGAAPSPAPGKTYNFADIGGPK
jgi:hypothetical protein